MTPSQTSSEKRYLSLERRQNIKKFKKNVIIANRHYFMNWSIDNYRDSDYPTALIQRKKLANI
jgi:hypothetical protein